MESTPEVVGVDDLEELLAVAVVDDCEGVDGHNPTAIVDAYPPRASHILKSAPFSKARRGANHEEDFQPVPLRRGSHEEEDDEEFDEGGSHSEQ